MGLMQAIDELELREIGVRDRGNQRIERGAHFICGDGHNLSRSRQFTCDSTLCVLHSTPDGGGGRDPIANPGRGDGEDGNTRVGLITLVHPVLEVCEVTRNGRGPELVDGGLVTRDGGLAGDACPVGRGGVDEREVHIGICFNFVKLVGGVIGEELEDETRQGGGGVQYSTRY